MLKIVLMMLWVALIAIWFGGWGAIASLLGISKKPAPLPPRVREEYFRKLVEEGGGQWVGTQECEGLPYDLILFNSRKTGSTLAVKTTAMSATAVRERLHDHESEWARIVGYNG